MKANWSADTQEYYFQFDSKELGLLIFAMTLAKINTKDSEIATVHADLLNAIDNVER